MTELLNYDKNRPKVGEEGLSPNRLLDEKRRKEEEVL